MLPADEAPQRSAWRAKTNARHEHNAGDALAGDEVERSLHITVVPNDGGNHIVDILAQNAHDQLESNNGCASCRQRHVRKRNERRIMKSLQLTNGCEALTRIATRATRCGLLSLVHNHSVPQELCVGLGMDMLAFHLDVLNAKCRNS